MKRPIRILLIICMSTLVLFFSGVLAIGHFLQPIATPEYADAIIVVSGGGDERLQKGIELFMEGYSDILVLSGDAIDPASPSNAETMLQDAIAAGVPAEKVFLETESKTTNENALYVKQLLDKQGLKTPKKLILVTSSYHQRRLLQNFKSVYGQIPVHFINQPAQVPYWSANFWILNAKARDITMREFIKILWGQFTGQMSS